MAEPTERLSIDAATELMERALRHAGVPAETARCVAEALVAAEAEGQHGHGFSRLADYAAQVRSGKIKAKAVPSLVHTAPAAVRVDAGYGFAYPALDIAIPALAEAAHAFGCASASIVRSHHCGALSVQVEKIARRALVGFMVANTPAAIAPWGAAEPVYGTNPIAFAVPREGADPLVIDMSLSRAARGKVMHARKTGQPIAGDWALDRDGNPTTDAEAALAGSLIPIGGAKGAALALMVEILAGPMTGANLSREAGSFFTADGPAPGTGQFLMALKPPDDVNFASRIETMLGAIAAVEGARLPGSGRTERLAQARREGIEVARAYLASARTLADAHA